MTDQIVELPALPAARQVTIPAGKLFVRDLPGPPGAPTLILLHGWTATADLNFFRCFAPLAEHFRVVAYDQRGHGRGIRSARRFRLADCADDVVAVADALGIERFVPVGYSLGGAVAQLTARRHPDRLDGVVLCATAAHFSIELAERMNFLGLTGLAAAARLMPAPARRWMTDRFYLQRKRESWGGWAVDEAAKHNWRMMLEAGQALGNYRADEWMGSVSVPASVIVMTADTVVPVTRQRRLAELLADVEVFTVAAGHDAAVTRPRQYVAALVEAVESVLARSQSSS